MEEYMNGIELLEFSFSNVNLKMSFDETKVMNQMAGGNHKYIDCFSVNYIWIWLPQIGKGS